MVNWPCQQADREKPERVLLDELVDGYGLGLVVSGLAHVSVKQCCWYTKAGLFCELE
jgi:hypothetical protein